MRKPGFEPTLTPVSDYCQLKLTASYMNCKTLGKVKEDAFKPGFVTFNNRKVTGTWV